LITLALSGYFNLLFLFLDFIQPIKALSQLDLGLSCTFDIVFNLAILGYSINPAAFSHREDL
jgi:hypothetical protein